MDENQSVCHVCNQKFPTFELEMHFLECQMQDDNGNQQNESFTPNIGSELMPDQSYASNYTETHQNVASDNFNDVIYDNQVDTITIKDGCEVEDDNGNQSNPQGLDSTANTCKFCGKSFASDFFLKVSLSYNIVKNVSNNLVATIFSSGISEFILVNVHSNVSFVQRHLHNESH